MSIRKKWVVTCIWVVCIAVGIGVYVARSQASQLPLPETAQSLSPEDARSRAQHESRDPFAHMEPSQVVYPAVGISTVVGESGQFDPSKYGDLDTLRLPDDPTKAVHYSKGAPLGAAPEGTTLIAAHATVDSSVHAAFRDLYKARPGDIAATTDSQGVQTMWVVTQVFAAPHHDFPASLFTATGPRQLVLVTCGGEINSQYYFDHNVIAVAVPFGR